jgi:hypothetical protein
VQPQTQAEVRIYWAYAPSVCCLQITPLKNACGSVGKARAAF